MLRFNTTFAFGFLFVFCVISSIGCKNQNRPANVSGPVSVSKESKDFKETSHNSSTKKTHQGSNETNLITRDDSNITPVFENVSPQAGLKFTYFNDEVENRFFFPEIMGCGVAWIDFDRDGWFDLCFPNGSDLASLVSRSDAAGSKSENENASPEKLALEKSAPSARDKIFRNLGGKFIELDNGLLPFESGFGHGVSVGDFNADGFDDLFIANYGENYLMVNNGDGSFDRIEDDVISQEKLWSTATLWVDADQDGDQDIVVVNYIVWNEEVRRPCVYNNVPGYCGPGNFEGTKDTLYLNNGDGTFSTDPAMNLDRETKGLAVVAADFNNDRIPEIYIGSDLTKNTLYQLDRSSEKMQLNEIAENSGVALSGSGTPEASMGITVHDFCGDENFEIFLSHYMQMKNTLYENLGGMLFEDVSRRSRIAVTGTKLLAFGTFAIDYDLNGVDDLFITNGNVLGKLQSQHKMTPQLLMNNGKGRFFDISETAGDFFSTPEVGRGAAESDFDNDGDIDFCVTTIETPSALVENKTESTNHFVSLHLVHPTRRDIAGTRIIVRVGEKTRFIPVVSGGSYLSINDPRIHFGIGQEDSIDELIIEWATGETDRWANLKADEFYLIMPKQTPQKISVK